MSDYIVDFALSIEILVQNHSIFRGAEISLQRNFALVLLSRNCEDSMPRANPLLLKLICGEGSLTSRFHKDLRPRAALSFTHVNHNGPRSCGRVCRSQRHDERIPVDEAEDIQQHAEGRRVDVAVSLSRRGGDALPPPDFSAANWKGANDIDRESELHRKHVYM